MAVLRAARLWIAELEPGSTLPPPAGRRGPVEPAPAPQETELTVFQVPPGKKAIVRTMTHVFTGSIPIAAQTGMWVHVLTPGDTFGIAVHRYWQPVTTAEIFAATLTDLWVGTLVLNEGDAVRVSNTAYHYLASHGSGMLVDA